MASSSSSSSSSSRSKKYDVFLSFRGEDTSKTFVDHLYSALERHAIHTYKDDVTLDRGDTIGPALLSAIRESHIALIIFFENYADSSWYLDELSYIMKCREGRDQIVIPIFYNMDPSYVRKQIGQFGEAFAKHKLSKNKNKVESWKQALVDASNIAGWEPKHVANGHEATCIQEIVDSILDKLSSLDSTTEDENLVGMETRLQQLKSHLRIGLGGVRMVGIWGIGGGGKTTLATSLYKEISPNFDGCCFLGNVRKETKQQGLQSLQKKILSTVFDKKMQVESVESGKHTSKEMLCRRNVLIVLDDVDDLEQLEALAGQHDWFGDGSRIIVTTRNEQVLISHKVDEVYPVSLLSPHEAIRLFRRHAYHVDKPVQDYVELSLRVISYVNGLPLALKVMGSFLYGKDKNEWMSALDKLKHIPNTNVTDQLKISYDGLDHEEKELFLDIACFHRGLKEDDAMEILDACGFHPGIGIKVLKQKALISVSKNGVFDMHDLVQEMAHYIVRGKHPNNPEKHSRLWQVEDVEDICSRNATTENDTIEAISCSVSPDFIMLVSNMKKLRSLRVNVGLMGTKMVHRNKVSLPMYTFLPRFLKAMVNINRDKGPSFLSNELRYLDWRCYPASPFPESFQLRKLVVLKMKSSLQKELWKGYKYLPCLKVLELFNASQLVKTPDFGGLPCLQKLIIYYCESLEEIHTSFGGLPCLVSVEVSSCEKLRRFPSIFGMEKLEILRISRCPALVEFPKIEGKMDNLVELYLSEVGIEVLPSSVGEYCSNLISLQLRKWCKLKSIESNFQALRKLNLGKCGLKDGEIPTEIGEFFSLQELDLSENEFRRLDFSLSRLTRLKLLNLSYCKKLVEFPELPSSLAILKAVNCWSLEDVIRDEIHTNCKWLSQVSIEGWGMKNIIGGGERLLKTMLQGNAVESGCMSLHLKGWEIARGFEPGLVRGRRCGMQLPENWFNDFSGFLFCAATSEYLIWTRQLPNMKISMKHGEEEENGGRMGLGMGMGDSQHDGREWYTWVGYIPFSKLRHTSWWDPTSTAIHMKMDYTYHMINGCGLKLVPKRGGAERSGQMETTTIHSSSSSSEFSLDDDDDDDYKCKLRIQHDSKSALKCGFVMRDW